MIDNIQLLAIKIKSSITILLEIYDDLLMLRDDRLTDESEKYINERIKEKLKKVQKILEGG